MKIKIWIFTIIYILNSEWYRLINIIFKFFEILLILLFPFIPNQIKLELFIVFNK